MQDIFVPDARGKGMSWLLFVQQLFQTANNKSLVSLSQNNIAFPYLLFPNDYHMGESCFGMLIYHHPTAGCYEKNTATTACPLFVK